jgi:alginate O-acetyltransferase complex protein AlgI
MWGLIHAMLYIPLFLKGKNRQYTTSVVAEGKWLPSLKELFQMGTTFFFTMVAWVFFRSEDIINAFGYITSLISKLTLPNSNLTGIPFMLLLIPLDWLIREDERNPLKFGNFKVNLIFASLIFIIIIIFPQSKLSSFIYFQF